ncbi:hypothetical protein BH09SUM1_BH09SUM1_25200 [soil metagenome]
MSIKKEPVTVTLLDEVEKCEKDIVEHLLAIPDKKAVRIVINSGGGSVYASLGISTVIQMKKLQAEAIVLADCSSSALLVFATCKVRKVAPHASFLFHPMRWSSEDQSRLPGAKSWAAEFQRVNAVCEDWLVRHLAMPRKTLKSWLREERYVQAEELFELGIAEPLDLHGGNVIDIALKSRRTGSRGRQEKPARIRRVG